MHLFDSNIIIYHLNDVLPTGAGDRIEYWISEGAFISVITRIEVLGYGELTSEQERQASTMVGYFTELPLGDSVVERTIALRQHHSVRLGDAIIAASALEHDLSLVTRNTGDFEQIKEVRLINPFEG